MSHICPQCGRESDMLRYRSKVTYASYCSEGCKYLAEKQLEERWEKAKKARLSQERKSGTETLNKWIQDYKILGDNIEELENALKGDDWKLISKASSKYNNRVVARLKLIIFVIPAVLFWMFLVYQVLIANGIIEN